MRRDQTRTAVPPYPLTRVQGNLPLCVCIVGCVTVNGDQTQDTGMLGKHPITRLHSQLYFLEKATARVQLQMRAGSEDGWMREG